MPGPLRNAHAVTKLPAQDLDRARRFYRDKLGLEPVEERVRSAGGLCDGHHPAVSGRRIASTSS